MCTYAAMLLKTQSALLQISIFYVYLRYTHLTHNKMHLQISSNEMSKNNQNQLHMWGRERSHNDLMWDFSNLEFSNNSNVFLSELHVILKICLVSTNTHSFSCQIHNLESNGMNWTAHDCGELVFKTQVACRHNLTIVLFLQVPITRFHHQWG